MARWMLPDGIEEVLPARARVMEQLRRRLLDYYSSCGYDLIMTPFIEYLDALLAGTGQELDTQTFKMSDPVNGRQIGIRADMTLQAARIDAHQIRQDSPVRLCYLGTVLRTHADGFASSRAPLQVGAELYGHAGVESDLEIIEVMLQTLKLLGVEQVQIDLGHVGIFRSLVAAAALSDETEQKLFDALQRKAVTDIREILDGLQIDDQMRGWLMALSDLNGGAEALQRAKTLFADAGEDVHAAIDELLQTSELLKQRQPELSVHYDLAELRGYSYQTGMVFAAFVPGHGQEVARGGRYDEIGSIFGRSRPAIGFSADLKLLLQLSSQLPADDLPAIFAPADNDPALQKLVDELRQQGKRVIRQLPGQAGGAVEMGCARQLVLKSGSWQIVDL